MRSSPKTLLDSTSFFFFFLTEHHVELWEMPGGISVGKLSQ